MFNQLILFPFGGNARDALVTIYDINLIKKQWEVVGFIDDDPGQHGNKALGVRVLGDKKVLGKYPRARILAVPGNPLNFSRRKRIIDSLDVPDERFVTVIHPGAAISPDVKIGLNTVIMANVVIGCGASIGNHCVILPNTTIAHESRIDDYTLVGANVVISGFVHVHSNCYVGSGSRIRDHITVGQRSLIGLGANVVKDVEKEVVVAGNPAKLLRKIRTV